MIAAVGLGPVSFWRLDECLFASSVAALALVWLAYPAAVALWAGLAPHRPSPARWLPRQWPRLSVIVAAHNEAAHIEARLRNLWQQDYPADRMEILVSEDGSSDGTGARARAVSAAGGRVPVVVLSGAERLGKARAINRAVESASGDILIFSDANNEYGPRALRHLVAPFADGSVGAVTGRKTVASHHGLGGGESVYFRFEAWLIRNESRTGSTVAAFGEALAVRRECFRPIPTGAMINDDLHLALQVLAQGRRLVFADEARSFELGAPGEGVEWERRQRMTVGRWEALAQLWRGPAGAEGARPVWRRLGWANGCKVLFHEVLRPLSGLFLGLALVAGLALLVTPAAAAVPALLARLAVAQAGCWSLVAAVGLLRWRGVHVGPWGARRGMARLGMIEAPYFFCLALAASLLGGWRYLRGNQSPLWRHAARTPPAPATRPEAAVGSAPSREPPAAAAADRGHTPPAPGSPGPGPGTNNSRILQGLFWASSSFLLGKLLVFGSIAVLARLLSSQAFGAVALATSAIMVLEIFATLGLTSALIYERHDVGAAANLCFWMTLGATLIETGAGWYAAPYLAGFFHEPNLTAMVRALLISMVLMALGNTQDTLLRRRLSFRAKLLPDLGMAAAKGGAGIVLALLGWGAWSLIWGQVLGTAVSTALLWWVCRYLGVWRPQWPWRPGAMPAEVGRRMFAYAKHIYLLDGSSVLLTNFDSMTIGRMLGDAWLGFYTLAFRIPEVLLLSVLNVITRVVFPALSLLQNDREALRSTLLDTARYATLLTLPMAAGIAILARPIVLGLYGWHWGPSIGVLRVLALYAGIRCLTHHFGDAYKAIGRPDILTRVTLAWWLLLPPDLILGARFGGIVGVAWGQTVTRALMTALHMYLISRVLDVTPGELVRCFGPALECTGWMGASLLLLLRLGRNWAARPELAVMMLAGMVVYAVALRLRYPRVLAAIRGRVSLRLRAPKAPPATPPESAEVDNRLARVA